MPVNEEVWYCSECNKGPYNWGYQHSCATCGHTRCKKCRVENGDQRTLYISLHKAVEENNMDMVLQLLNNGADVNMRQDRMPDIGSPLVINNRHSETPLDIAISDGLLDIAKVLIENGADANAKNSDLDTPLHLAVEFAHLDIINILIENGADINAKNSIHDTPLHIAVSRDLNITKFLIENGADINAKNSDLDTPLHTAVSHRLDITKFLIENGADINAKNSNHDTPLHTAVSHDLDIIKVLIENGADINAKNSDFDTALHIAVQGGLLDIIKMLIEAGADVSEKTRTLNKLLHIAVEGGDLDMIELSLDKGANPNIISNSSRTILTMALQKLSYGVVEALLQAGALTRETFWEQLVSEQNVSQGITVDIVMDWDVSLFIESGFSEPEDFRKAVTLTGSVQNAQMMSCEDYVTQTWGDSGLRVLDILIRALKSKTAVTDIFDGQTVRFLLHKRIMRIVAEASKGGILDLMEQIAWLGSVFTREKMKSEHGLFLATGSYVFSPRSGTYQLNIQSYPLEGYLNEPCWTKILRNATLAVGFPVRKRPEGVGLEIPFPLLLRFADISVCMEYRGGTLLVGPSNILFPSRKLEDGIQWHIADATSAHEAARVIDHTPDWIRTNNIGQLVEQRAYLGYCSHALVLLGTHELLLSQATSELWSSLPKSKSQIEMAHEGTMSAGFSIRGIFNTTVGGKWTLPPRLNVSLEDNRDLEDLLLTAHRRPILVYDRNEDRGWLVPELSLVFHMALTYLHQADVRQRCPPSVQETLPNLTAAVDDGLEIYNLVKKSWNLELYKKIEDGQMKTFGMVIRDFITDLQKLRTAENIRRIEKGFKLSLFSSRTLRGWDFSELTFKAENMFQREMKWEDGGPMWVMLGDTHDMLVILGSDFGSLIRPNLDITKVASGWENIPKGAGLLAATNSCVKQLSQNQVLPTLGEMKASKQRFGNLFWYRPAAFHADCNLYCNQSCLVIHEIARRHMHTCTEMQDPRKLEENGAVVFGCASSFHRSLERK